jgi:hypothetical protein
MWPRELKILSRITEPTGGRAIITGRPQVQPAARGSVLTTFGNVEGRAAASSPS